MPLAPHGAERRVTHDAMIKCKNINGMIPHLVRDQKFMGKKGYRALVYARGKKGQTWLRAQPFTSHRFGLS